MIRSLTLIAVCMVSVIIWWGVIVLVLAVVR